MTSHKLRLALICAFGLLPCTFMGCSPSDEVPADQVEQHEIDAAEAASEDDQTGLTRGDALRCSC